MSSEIRQSVLEVTGVVLKCDVKDIPESADRESFEQWDSLGHMTLMLALEEEFGVTFSNEEIAELSSIDAIVDSIAGKQR